MPLHSLGGGSAWALTTNTDQVVSASKIFQSSAAASVPLAVRGAVSQTGNLQEWQTDTGNVRTTVRVGGIYTWGKLQVGELNDDLNQQMLFASTNGNMDVFTVRGAASQAGYLTTWQNNTGGMLAWIDSAGGYNTAGQRTMILGSTGRIASIQENHSFGTRDFFGGDPVMGLQPTATTRKGLVIRGLASQTGNLQEWQNSAGTVLASVNSAGYVQGIDTGWRVVGTAGQPAFENGWTHYGGEWEAVAFRKDAQGYVHIKGLIRSGTLGTATPCFTLPVGYRPPANGGIHFTTWSNGAPCGVRIWAANGSNVPGGVCLGGDANFPGSNAWVSVNFPPFLAES